MLIHCTKKLMDEIKIKPSNAPDDCDPMYSWRAHIIDVNRKKTVVLMCDLNRYVVVLYGLKAKDMKNINQRIVEAIRHTLLRGQINPEVIERYLAEAGEPVFVKNTGRSQTARLNNTCETVYFSLRDVQDNYSDSVGVITSNWLVGGTEKDFIYPDEKMIEDLRRLGIEPVLKCCAFELTVRLSLISQDAIRKLIVPADITFFELHKVLQAAFGWSNYHLFDFQLFKSPGLDKASVELVASDEDLEYRDSRARLMDGIRLSDYLPHYKYLLYNYDFGDDWQHHIEVTGVYDGCSDRIPLLIAGVGNTPPEDVGGEGGYEDFLEIMANPAHEEFEYMRAWAKGQRYEEFDYNEVNWRVKSSLLR